MTKALHKIAKQYTPRGPMQQYRMEAAIAFHCFRCGQHKKSKLLTVYAADWGKLLCNGCYGWLLSIYEIKGGTAPEDDKAEALAKQLLSLASEDKLRQIAEKMQISEERVAFLSPQSLRYLATSEHVAASLDAGPSLDWSPAVIGLCKAVEIELVRRFFEPLRVTAATYDLAADMKDPGLNRIARYCAGRASSPPELGAMTFFLQTAAHSKDRIERSPLLQAAKKVLSDWPHSDWLIDSYGGIEAIQTLTSRFRNRAAHIDDLSKADYDACLGLVTGNHGLLWHLVSATERA